MALTDTAVRSLKPGPKNYREYDERGLYVEVTPAGGKYWRFKYRFNSKEKLLALGSYPDVSLKAAREGRDDARKLVAAGVDPALKRQEEKRAKVHASSNTFEGITREWFEKQKSGWVQDHADRVIAMFENKIFPYLGHRPIADIAAPEVLEVVQRVEKIALDTSHRALADCGRVFRYAVATHRATTDPTFALKGALAPRRGGHFAATMEPKRLGQILRALDEYRGTAVVRAALRLAPLVFVRPGELRHGEWPQFNLQQAQWEYTITKTNTPHIVPLSTQALEILEELYLHTGKRPETVKTHYTFRGARSASRPMSENAVLAAMRSLEIGADEMCGHGFRAVARTILDEVLKFRPDIIDHQLGHVVRDTNGRAYNRTTHLDDRRVMMQAWADHLDSLKASGS